jgi:hypothetical protein
MNYYAKMVGKMLLRGYHLAVNSHIISEVINVVMRKEWKQLMLDYPEFGYTMFKDFRDSAEGSAALDAIHKVIEKSYSKSLLERISMSESTKSPSFVRKAKLRSLQSNTTACQ